MKTVTSVVSLSLHPVAFWSFYCNIFKTGSKQMSQFDCEHLNTSLLYKACLATFHADIVITLLKQKKNVKNLLE